MPITPEQLDHWFSYHPPSPDRALVYAELRKAGLAFAQVIVASTPPCADQSAAVRLVREAVMTANAAIACEGR